MRPSTIWYTLKQGVKNIKRNWMFPWLPLSPWLPVFFCFGIFFSIVNNVNIFAHKVEQEVPNHSIFESRELTKRKQNQKAKSEKKDTKANVRKVREK